MTKKHIKIRRLWRTYRGLILLGGALITTLMLCAACTTNSSANDYCYLYRPILPDYQKDTPETIRQIDENNIVFDTICGK